jgi:glycine betaine transporter
VEKKNDQSVKYMALVIIVAFVLWGFVSPESLSVFFNEALAYITHYFGWLYMLSTSLFLIFALFLAFGPYGKIKLGKEHDKPEYGLWTWLAMLFSGGMGIGLIFWGVAEPVYHYLSPPDLAGEIEAQSADSALIAMVYSFFHWGFHPWGIFTIVGLALAYAKFRKGEKGLISVIFRPLFGNKVDGPLGKSIDILAIIATVFGVATSLGLGTLQINGGISRLFGVPNHITVQLLIIAVISFIFISSSALGIDRGMRHVSNINLSLSGLLMLFILIVGPTVFILDTLTTSIGSYLNHIVLISFNLGPFIQSEWIGQWTLFYWAWWIAWAPFVGSFIARISKGRTIREFVAGVLIVPTLLGILWFSIFGGTALNFEIFAGLNIAQAVERDITTALFILLEHLPLGFLWSIIATILIVTYFVTSADAATHALGMLTSNGNLHPKVSTRVIWGLLQSGIAAVLLLSGGLSGLQTASIVAALPFCIVMLLMVISIYKALSHELKLKENEGTQRDSVNQSSPIIGSLGSGRHQETIDTNE